ncbi:MAG: hypothetical protein K6G05_09590 [Lachnospiraceae bacterium]|nr:hypothetical protein [Lachnospiraceae bacterium]
MSNSEDYLDGLLDSISEAKTNVKNAAAREERKRAEKVARRNRINPDDDFMDATGISSYEPTRVSRKNLREAFSESDFLRDFEDELLGDDVDDEEGFVSDFEKELAADFGLDMDDSESEELPLENAEEELDAPLEDLTEESVEGSMEESMEETFDLDFDELPLDDEDGEDQESIDEAVEENVQDVLDDSIEEPSEEVREDSSEETSEEAAEDVEDIEEAEEDSEEAEAEEDLEEAEAEDATAEEELEVESLEDSESGEEEPLEDSDGDSSVDDILSAARMKMDGEEAEEESLLQPEFQPDELDLEELPLETSEDEMPSLLDEDGDSDLMDLLGGDSDLADIGDLLAADENDIELQESRDSYEAGADGISLDDVFEEPQEDEKKGVFGKIQKFFRKLFEHKDNDPSGEHTVEILDHVGPEDFSAENADLLNELDGEPAAPLDKKAAKEEAKKQAKAEKEKKKKEAAAEKEKKKKAAEEAKKRKAEEKAKTKANKPKDNSPKIPIKAFIPFLLLGVSIIALVMVATNVLSAHKAESMAKKYFDNGDYEQAYKEISNMTFKDEEDIQFQETVHMMAELQLKYERYQSFMELQKYDMALDELVNGYGRYRFNAETASGLGISDSYDALGQSIANQMMDQFGVTTERAEELYVMHDRKEYTKAIIEIIENLGMSVENQYE